MPDAAKKKKKKKGEGASVALLRKRGGKEKKGGHAGRHRSWPTPVWGGEKKLRGVKCSATAEKGEKKERNADPRRKKSARGGGDPPAGIKTGKRFDGATVLYGREKEKKNKGTPPALFLQGKRKAEDLLRIGPGAKLRENAAPIC